MTSPAPLAYETCYHIFNRGNNRENIFVQERNYAHFLKLYARYIDPVAETFAFCLLKNHFHLLARIRAEEEIIKISKTLKVSFPTNTDVKRRDPRDQHKSQTKKPLGSDYPSKGFSDFFNAYAKAINAAYGRTGSLFQHPFGRVMVTNERQFWNVVAYIHQNPQKHKFVDDFREWRWSSYGIMLSDKPTHLQRNAVLEWFGGKEQYLERHAQMVSEADSKWFVEEDED
jgi:REP element-mobilizing transposase RayT